MRWMIALVGIMSFYVSAVWAADPVVSAVRAQQITGTRKVEHELRSL